MFPPRDKWPVAGAFAVFVVGALVGVAASNPELSDPYPGHWAFATSVLYETARVPVVQSRLFWQITAAFWPGVLLLLFISAALLCDRLAILRRRRSVEIIAALVVLGYILWFLRFGSIDWKQPDDWYKDWAYFAAAKQAVTNLQWPYYLVYELQGTSRVLANLEMIWAPHVVLLRLLSVETFFIVNVLLCVAAGLVGLVWLRRELNLTFFAWSAFLLIFALNGHVTAHLSVGHTQWAGYYLLPLVFLFVIRAANGDVSRRNVVLLAGTLAWMIAIGAWHVFVWSFVFASLASLSSLARMKFIAVAAMCVAGLAAFRLLPALATFGSGSNAFIGGYEPWMFIDALVGDPRNSRLPLAWHEFDMFIGWSGFALLALGLMPRFSARRPVDVLWIPSVAMIVLSLYEIYRNTLFRLPGFVSERVSTRLAVVGVLGLVLLGVERVSRWNDEKKSPIGVVTGLGFAVFLVMQLILRAENRRPRALVVALNRVEDVIKPMAVEPSYFWSIWIGVAVSLATTAFLILWIRQNSRSA